MKNLNLSYILFGVFIITIVSVLIFGKKDSGQTDIEVLSFPNPEEVKEEVKEKIEEAKEEVTDTVKEKMEEIEDRLEELIPEIDIPSLKKDKLIEIPLEVPVEAPAEEAPEETVPVQDSTKVEDSSDE